MRRVVPPPPIACLQARGFSASPIPRARDLVSAAGGNGINNDEPAAAAPGSTKTRILWVQRAGAKAWVEMPINSTSSVACVVKNIKTELASLRDVDADSITLQLAVKDAGGTDKLVALDSMDTVDEALTKALGGAIKPTDKLRLIVAVDALAATAHAAYRGATSGPAALPALPPASLLTEVTLGGETWLEMAVLLKSTGVTRSAPVFFTVDQIDSLRTFIREEPSTRPQALMLVGTIKSGKSTLLHTVLPGLIAAEHASGKWQPQRPRPVIFTYSFPLNVDAETAAMDVSRALAKFARKINTTFDMEATPGDALDNLPENVRELCERVYEGGGELWLLLDELQGPGLNSSPSVATRFTYTFKTVSRADALLWRFPDLLMAAAPRFF